MVCEHIQAQEGVAPVDDGVIEQLSFIVHVLVCHLLESLQVVLAARELREARMVQHEEEVPHV